MPRQPRQKSESGIYHIMLRGINRQIIFEDSEDQERFLDTLKKYREQCGYKVYAYCFMGNHVHLLLKEGNEDLAHSFKRIAGSYVYWYNQKYDRCGHLFQDRFRSEAITNDGHYLTVLRYIHQNPVKAGLCKKVQDYAYSSIGEYLKEPFLVDTELTYALITQDQLLQLHSEEVVEPCLDIEEHYRVSEAEAKKIMLAVSDCTSSAEFQKLDKTARDRCLRAMRKRGLSVRQINRLTGIARETIAKN